MIPDLGQSPAAGTRVAEGPLLLSFSLGAGNDLRLSVGTSKGASDAGSFSATLPDTVSITVPANPVVWCSAWVTNTGAGTFHTYSWAYGVGAGNRSPAQVEHEEELQFLVDNWKRSALAGFAQGLVVEDPGHGRDEICPVVLAGQPFDPTISAHVAPFTSDQVIGPEGVGYLVASLGRLRDPEVLSPGSRPEMRSMMQLEITIVTPAGKGPKLANLYAGALAMLFRYLVLEPGEGIDRIINREPPDERTVYDGEDGAYRYDRWAVKLERYFRGDPAGNR